MDHKASTQGVYLQIRNYSNLKISLLKSWNQTKIFSNQLTFRLCEIWPSHTLSAIRLSWNGKLCNVSECLRYISTLLLSIQLTVLWLLNTMKSRLNEIYFKFSNSRLFSLQYKILSKYLIDLVIHVYSCLKTIDTELLDIISREINTK